MCFSASASFAVAAATAATGLAVLGQAKRWRDAPLAVVPLLFAAQQATEGMLWLQLAGDGRYVAALAFVFLLFAKVVWPAYTALAVLLIEPAARRRRLLGGLAVIGAALSLYLLVGLFSDSPGASINGRSIDYTSDADPLSWQQLPYLLCTGAALLLSSHRTIRLFGVAVLVGFFVSAYMSEATFISVWCFFAAFGSALLYFHFRSVAIETRLAHR